MRVWIKVFDENGRPQNDELIRLEPFSEINNGIATTYRFVFEFSKLNENILAEMNTDLKEGTDEH